jgi:SSS family solute:Na+ symporter
VGRIGRITTLVLMLIAAAWAPAILEFKGLWTYIQQMLSYLVPPVVAIFLLGVFWPRANGNGAFVTLLGGHALSLAAFLLKVNGVFDIHFTILAGILTALCLGLCVAASLALGDAPAPEKTDDLTWAGRAIAPPSTLAWYKDWRVHSAAVLGLTTVMIVVFW